MERYSEYKDSGVQWIGEIPGHWKTVRLKRICNMKNGNNLTSNDISDTGDYPVYGANGFRGFYKSYNKEGEYLIVGRQGALAGNVHRVCGRFWATDHAVVTTVSNFQNIGFVYYSLKAMNLNQYAFDTAAQPGLAVSRIIALHTTLPPLPEQQAIVAYLDDKCAKLDRLVANKEKEIELLKEMKQRVIADAVTKGLNPDVKFKQTGISWLPQIPEHWEIHRAKNLFNKEQRLVQDGDDIVTCFRDGQVTLRKNRRTTGFTEATNFTGYQHVCKGDLVIHQMDAFAGSSGVSDSDGMCTPVLSVCTAKTDKTDNYYYAHILRLMGKSGFILSLYRGIRERSSDFRFDTFSKQYLPIPPLEEQKAIVSYINERVGKIDTLSGKLQKEIENIKEYKQRLISDVVTGQIKVC